MDLTNQRKIVDELKTKHQAFRQEYKKTKEELNIKKEELEKIIEAKELVLDTVQAIQIHIHEQISKVVTMGLQTVFENPYTFKINFEQKRGRTEGILMFERDGEELDPMDESGGGVVDVAAFTLRVACLLLSRPGLRRVLVLDEPFKNVSERAGYLKRIPELIHLIEKEFKIQIIMVTHIEELEIGKVIEI